jgi:hypothetical protein
LETVHETPMSQGDAMHAQAPSPLHPEQSEAPAGATRQTRGRSYWIRTIACWISTFIVVFEMAAGSVWDLLRIEYVRVIMSHLGYPLYFLSILGAWKLAGAAAVLAPRFPRLKEWAYAGFFFNYSGASASHFFAGDAVDRWLPPAVFAAFTVASWALRPAHRRLPADGKVAAETRLLDWAIPIGVLLLMLVVTYVTLPKGAPPGY